MINKQPTESWDYEISSKRSIFKINFSEVWRYRDLVALFVKRDFVSIYKQTILGPIWLFLQPILTTFIYIFIFGNLANLGTDGIPKPLFYLVGIVSWNFFSECFSKTSTVFLTNSAMFSKVYFPRLIMPISILFASLVRLLIQLVLITSLIGYFILFRGLEFHFAFNIFYLPGIILLLSLIGTGLGMLVSALTIKYRDVNNLISFGIQLLMYASPVVYSLSGNLGKYASIVKNNPLSPLIEGFRNCLLKNQAFEISTLGYPLFISILLITLGVLVFNSTEKDFIDTV